MKIKWSDTTEIAIALEECHPEKDIPRYLKLVNCGILNLEPIISQRFSLNEINHAISLVRNGSVAGRVMIDLNK